MEKITEYSDIEGCFVCRYKNEFFSVSTTGDTQEEAEEEMDIILDYMNGE